MKITLLTGQTFDIQEHLDFDILVVRSTQAKRLTLRIDEKKHLPVLTIPPRCSSQKALDFGRSPFGAIPFIMHSLAKMLVIRSSGF